MWNVTEQSVLQGSWDNGPVWMTEPNWPYMTLKLFITAECERGTLITYSTYLLSWSLSSVRIIMIIKVLLFCCDPYYFMESMLHFWSSGCSHCLLTKISWRLTCSELLAIDLCTSKTVLLFFHLLSCALSECQELHLSFYFMLGTPLCCKWVRES